MRGRESKKMRPRKAELRPPLVWRCVIGKTPLTNAPIELLSFSECFLLYGVRWQIELLFKLWKSHGKLGHSNSKNKWRILCELYCKLLAVMVQHWIFLTGLWPIP